jgi:hypothetical protein
VDKANIFSALPRVVGLRVLSSEEAAEAMRKDPGVRIVELDSDISLEES